MFCTECKEFYDDYWIFGEGAPLGPKKNTTDGEQDYDNEDDAGSGLEDEEEGLTAEDLAGFEKRCKPEPREPCQDSTYGCCPDGFNAALGPFGQECPEIRTCDDTRYGCCKDGVTPANGTAFKVRRQQMIN